MKKIGLITYHNPCNYGATLQAKASVEFFKELGYNCEIIDYTPITMRGFGKFSNAYNSVSNSKFNSIKRLIVTLLKLPSYRLMKRKFDIYVKDELVTTKNYDSIEKLKLSVPEADIYCTGSDQVWNNYYTRNFEDAFFLDFTPSNKLRISFSSSFGKTDYTDEEKAYIKDKLKKYSYLSVREESGVSFLKNLGFQDVDLILDPTLMIKPTYWDDYAKEINENNYVLVYQIHGDSKAFEYAKEYARKKNKKIIKISSYIYHQKFGCKNVLLPDINEFLGLFKQADKVFTDSFHGTVFSLLYEKNLSIVLPTNFSGRIGTLLNRLQVNNLVIENKDDIFVDNIDYSTITYRLNMIRENDRNKIKNALQKLDN